MENIIWGKVWKREKVDTADIISTKVWLENLNNLDPDILGKHAMAPIDRDFAARAMKGDFRIIVSGKNFGGGGKSFEHGVIAMKAVGIVLVVAESFARYNFRNSINNGLPVLECKGIFNAVEAGDEIEADLSTGVIRNLTSGTVLQAPPCRSSSWELWRPEATRPISAPASKRSAKKSPLHGGNTMKSTVDRLRDTGIIPSARLSSAEEALPLGKALTEGDSWAVEIQHTEGIASESARILSSELPELLVGVAGVRTAHDAKAPDRRRSPLSFLLGNEPGRSGCLPGRGGSLHPFHLFPREVEESLSAGLTAVKLCPAEQLGGPTAVGEFSRLFPEARFMPSGGVNPGTP